MGPSTGGVCGRAAALTEDALRLGELNEFPDDQEVTGEPEVGDEDQFMLKLPVLGHRSKLSQRV